MKKQICTAIAALLAGVCLTGCSGGLVNLDYKEGQLVNKRLGLAYNAAPTSYQPVAIGEAYGYYGDIDMTLYEISGLDPKEWLTQENAGSATTIFYADGITLPTLAEMAPEQIHITTGDNIIYGVGTVDDAAVVAEAVELFTNGTEAEWPMLDSMTTYEMKFVSSSYASLYFNLTYSEFEEGIFLYDRNTKRCVEIGDLFENWIENQWEG